MGNRKFWCRVWLHPSPSMRCTTYTVFPPALEFVLALEGSDMDQDHVSHPQGHCLAPFVIITFMAPCLLLLKEVTFSMGPPNVFCQFLDICGCGHSYQFRGKSERDVERELRLSPIHEEIGAETCGGILGAVVSLDQYSNAALLVRLTFWRQSPQHINEGGVKSLTLAIHLWVIWTSSEFLGPHKFTEVRYEPALEVPTLI